MASFIESATLRVVDQSSGPLEKINAALNKTLATAGKLANVQAGTRWNFSQAIGDLSRLAAAADRAAGAVSKITAAAARSIGGAAGSNPFAAVAASSRAAQSASGAIAANIARAAGSANQYAAAMQRAANVPPPKLPPPGGPGSGAPGANGGPFGFVGGSGRNNGFPGNVPYIAGRYLGWNAVAASHQAVNAAGAGVIDAGNQRDMLEIMNLPSEVAKDLITASDKAGSVFKTQTRAGLMELGRDAAQFLAPEHRNEGGITQVLDAVSKAAAYQTALRGNSDQGNEAARQMLRGLENIGKASDPAKATQYLDSILAASLLGGKNWNPGMFATGMAQIGPQFTGGLSSRFVGVMAGMMDDVRGQMAPQIRTFMSNVTREQVSDKAREQMIAAGLRNKDGSVADGAEFYANPDEWARKKLGPLVDKISGGRDKFNAMGEEAQYDVVNKAMTQAGLTTSGGRAPAYFLAREAELRKLEESRNRVDVSRKRAIELAEKNLQQSGIAVASKWRDAADSLTLSAQPLVAGGLFGLATSLDAIAKNPATAGLFGGAVIGGGMWAGHKIFEAVRDNPGVGAMGLAAVAHGRAASALTAAAAKLALAGRPITGPNVVGPPVMTPGAKGGIAGRVKGGLWGALGIAGAGLVAYDLAQAWKGAGGSLPDLSGIMSDSRVQLGAAAAAASVALSSKVRAALMAGVRGLNFVGLTTLIVGALDQVLTGGAISKAISDAVKKAFGLKSGSTEVPTAPDEVKKLQEKLKKEGFYNGPIDGKAGPQTDAAVKASDAVVKQKEDMARAAEAEIAAKRKEREAEVDKLKGGDGKEPLAREVLRDFVNFVGGDGNKVVNGIVDWNQKMVDADRARERDAFDLEGSAFSKAPEGRGIWQRFLDIMSQLNPISKAHGSEYVNRGASHGGGDVAGGGVPAGQGLGDSFANIGASMMAHIEGAQASILSTFGDAGGNLEAAGAAAGNAILDGGNGAAGAMGESIMSAGIAAGSAMAEAIAAAVSSINVNVSGGGPNNTGTNNLYAR